MMEGHYYPTGQVIAGHYHWVKIRGPGTESTYDWIEVCLPYLDEHGALVHWERCGCEVFLSPDRVQVIAPIPWPIEEG